MLSIALVINIITMILRLQPLALKRGACAQAYRQASTDRAEGSGPGTEATDMELPQDSSSIIVLFVNGREVRQDHARDR